MMTRVLVVGLYMAAALAGVARGAHAQDVVRTDDRAPLPTTRAETAASARPQLGGVLEQARSTARASTPRRRRGSMVGYVDDSTIESRFRLRFDAATGNTVPDRAEFFYAKCGCYRDLPRTNAAYDPNAPGPRPGAADDINFQQLYIEAEFAVDSWLSVFGQAPVRWLQPQSFIPGTGGGFTSQSGISDIRAGVKLGLMDTEASGVTAKVQVYFPSGDSAKGLGTNHASVEPAILFRQALSPRVQLESQLGVWLPVGGADPVPTSASGRFAGTVMFYGIGPSFTVYETDRVRFAPVVELVGWRVQNGNQTAAIGDASGTNIVNLKMGGRLTLDRGSVYLGYGHALTDASWYDDVVRVEYRYEF